MMNTEAAIYNPVENGGVVVIERPDVWTPEWVLHRLRTAFEVLRRSGSGRAGPKGFSNGWPEMLKEIPELAELKMHEANREDFYRNADRPALPNSLELDMMDEAFGWQFAYLSQDPLKADAIGLWAWCRAYEISCEGTLRKRRIVAERLMKDRYQKENAERAFKRREIASHFAKRYAIEAMTSPSPKALEARIRAEFNMEIATRGLLGDKRGKLIESMPGKCLTERVLTRQRMNAARVIREGLLAGRVVVR